jgi:curli biogenesis system outer membrane secretion channel CsgG
MCIYKLWNLCGRGQISPVVSLALSIWLVLAGGCNNVRYSAAEEAKYQKPTIAVMSFENQVPANNNRWPLGDGLADQLINRLMQTRRYTVLDRQQFRAIMAELNRGEDSRFNADGKSQLGRLKNVRYLVRATITDFGHVENDKGFWKIFDWGGDSYSIVAITMHVIDAQSGQVIAGSNVKAQVPDKKEKEKEKGKDKEKSKDKVTTDSMAFGSYTFYRTTLGQATSQMLDKAVYQIAHAIDECPYQPKIASIINERIIINGGKDRHIELGDEYLVRPASNTVVDPDSGDVLGHVTGEVLGQVRVIQVTDKCAIARIIKGNQFAPGQVLFKIDAETARGKTEVTPY